MFRERWSAILDRSADATALWYPGGQLTFAQLERQAQALEPQHCPQLGPFFLAQGEGAEILIALLAGFLRGLPVQVVEKDRQRRVPTCPAPADTALIKQTVGSSGVRRCQFFSLAQLLADVDQLHSALQLSQCQVALAPLSVAHSFGLTTTVLQTLFHGLPTHWLPTPFPMGMNEALAAHDDLLLPGVPAMWKAWLLGLTDLRHVRLAVSAGSPLTLALEQGVRQRFQIKLHNLYGASECGAISYDASETLRTQESDLGGLLPGVQCQYQEGRLLIHSPAVGLGYDAPLAGEIFHSGDHLTWDQIHLNLEDGHLHFQRCLGAGIHVASRKLSPAEIQAKITTTLQCPVQIYGQPSRDPERVEDIVCAVSRQHLPDLTPELKAQACATLAPWEVPRRWISV
jgi:long-chain acyl-CoA synthetase